MIIIIFMIISPLCRLIVALQTTVIETTQGATLEMTFISFFQLEVELYIYLIVFLM